MTCTSGHARPGYKVRETTEQENKMTTRNRTRRPRLPQAPPETPIVEGQPETRVPGTELVLANVPQQDVPDSDKPGKTKRAYVATPYQICKAANAILKARGIDKVLPPQMFYAYAKKGKFQCTNAPDGRKVVDRDSFESWFLIYCIKVERLQYKKAQAKAA
jgi:hypothetical protein